MSVGVSACSFSLANNVDKHPQILSSGSTPCTPKVTNNLVFKSGHMTQTCPIPLVQSECCPGIRAHTGEQRSCLLAQSGVATLQLPVVMLLIFGVLFSVVLCDFIVMASYCSIFHLLCSFLISDQINASHVTFGLVC